MEATILMRRTEAGLVAADTEAAKALAKVKTGDRVLVKVHRPRSIDQHRLFWGLLTHVAEATNFETPERLLTALKIALGRYDLLGMPNGKVVPVPHSISFASMGQDDFQRFFDDSVRLICERVLPHMTSEQLIAEVQEAIGARTAA